MGRALTDWLISSWQRSEGTDCQPTWTKGHYVQLAKLVRRLGEPEVRRRWPRYLADEFVRWRGHPLRLFATQADHWIHEGGARPLSLAAAIALRDRQVGHWEWRVGLRPEEIRAELAAAGIQVKPPK